MPAARQPAARHQVSSPSVAARAWSPKRSASGASPARSRARERGDPARLQLGVVPALLARLGGVEPALGVLGPAQVDRQPGLGQAEADVGHHGVGRQELQPALGGDGPAAAQVVRPVLGDQVGRLLQVARADRVVHSVVHRALGQMPGRRPPVQLGDLRRRRQRQLVLEQLAEQVVVAIPLAAVVQRHEEEVERSSSARMRAEPSTPATTSQRGPESRLSTEVRSRKSRRSGGSPSSTSSAR